MLRLNNIRLPLNHNPEALNSAVQKRLGIPGKDILSIKVFRRGYDARDNRAIKLVYTLDVEVKKERELLKKFHKDPQILRKPNTEYEFNYIAPNVLPDRPIVIGTGPAGLFAGLILAEAGYQPILIERGKKVRDRTVDTFAFWRESKLNPESNVQFGEGGAGTFSDGKLHTQTKDQFNRGRKVLDEFVAAGAPEEILYISKPHIGTLKLVKIVENIRNKIESLGGEFYFESKVVDLIVENGNLKGLVLEDGKQIKSQFVIAAIGHSARDTFKMLHQRGIAIEPKPFSIGVRIEHPQGMVDSCQFGEHTGNPILGAADYKLAHHCSNGRTVYSFCMCPGGTVLAASSEPGAIVTNGMSQYSRHERNANSALVVEVFPEDFPGHPLAGIDFQRVWEQKAFEIAGGNYHAPAQLLGDFMQDRPSTALGEVLPSYRPGIQLGNLSDCLPGFVVESLREALPEFDKRINGFLREDALLTAVETRTSSPLRIVRGPNFESISLKGFYPAGEGSGYSGGILSSAVDGIKAAEQVARSINHTYNLNLK